VIAGVITIAKKYGRFSQARTLEISVRYPWSIAAVGIVQETSTREANFIDRFCWVNPSSSGG
jgi:hypothetical protein